MPASVAPSVGQRPRHGSKGAPNSVCCEDRGNGTPSRLGPQSLLPVPDRRQGTSDYNSPGEGDTEEYVASALVDLELHLQPATDATFDIGPFEEAALARIGMPAEIVMRHRPVHFQHIFAGSGYAAAYYSYMWSEVLDADAFAAFEEVGDVFDPAAAKKLHDHVYAAGGSRDPAELYTAFRGRLPTPDGLLKRRGLSEAVGQPSE